MKWNVYTIAIYYLYIIIMWFRLSDMFWSMGQIGLTIVSVCAIRNTSWANLQWVIAVSDNIIIINCAIWPNVRTVCIVPNRKLFGSIVRHMSILKALMYLYLMTKPNSFFKKTRWWLLMLTMIDIYTNIILGLYLYSNLAIKPIH